MSKKTQEEKVEKTEKTQKDKELKLPTLYKLEFDNYKLITKEKKEILLGFSRGMGLLDLKDSCMHLVQVIEDTIQQQEKEKVEEKEEIKE